jgi:hypothetical protein
MDIGIGGIGREQRQDTPAQDVTEASCDDGAEVNGGARNAT